MSAVAAVTIQCLDANGWLSDSNITQPATIRKLKAVKSFPSHKSALTFVSLALSQRSVYTARPRIYRASALHGVPVHARPLPVLSHCTYSQRDGQAELT